MLLSIQIGGLIETDLCHSEVHFEQRLRAHSIWGRWGCHPILVRWLGRCAQGVYTWWCFSNAMRLIALSQTIIVGFQASTLPHTICLSTVADLGRSS